MSVTGSTYVPAADVADGAAVVSAGPAAQAVHLDCLSVDMRSSKVLPGPWSCR